MMVIWFVLNALGMDLRTISGVVSFVRGSLRRRNRRLP